MLLLSALITTIMCVCGARYSINTPNPNNGTFAFGYPSLVVDAYFPSPALATCFWVGNATKSFVTSISNLKKCNNPTRSNEFGVMTCSSSNAAVNSSFKFSPLYKSMSISVYCGSKALFAVSIHVRNCSSTIFSNVVVHADHYGYGAKGIFDCSNNGELIDSSGSKIQNSSTKCLAHAKWKGQEDVQCWNAPSVHLLPAAITGNQNEVLNISCMETSLAFPPVHLFELVVKDDNPQELSSSNGSITLKRGWNGKTASCQAISNYTIHKNKPALSQPVNITVHYDPYANQQPTLCTLYLGESSSSCKIQFYSNPPSYAYNLTKDGRSTTADKVAISSDATGLHTVIISMYKVSKSDAGQYTISVESSLHPGNANKRLVINFTVVVDLAPSVSQPNIALIAGTSAAGAVVVVLIAVMVVTLKRRCHNENERITGNVDPVISSPVIYHYISASEERHQSRDNRPAISQQAPSPSYESAHQYERPIRSNEQGSDGAYIDFNVL